MRTRTRTGRAAAALIAAAVVATGAAGCAAGYNDQQPPPEVAEVTGGAAVQVVAPVVDLITQRAFTITSPELGAAPVLVVHDRIRADLAEGGAVAVAGQLRPSLDVAAISGELVFDDAALVTDFVGKPYILATAVEPVR